MTFYGYMDHRRTSKRIQEQKQRELSAGNMSDAPAEEPDWLKAITKRLDAIESIQRSVFELKDISIPTIEKSIEHLHSSLETSNKTVTTRCNELESDVNALKGENARLKRELSETKEKLLYQQSQSKRNNLIFNGVEEAKGETWDDIEKRIYSILEKELKIENANKIVIERAHRIYAKREGQVRPVIVKFLSFKDRQLVWLSRTKINDKKLRIFEDYPAEITANRQQLWPIFKAAKQMSEFTSVQLKLDKLYVNGKQFTTDNLHELPPSLHADKRSTKFTDQTVVFYSKHSVFSNFHKLNVKIEGETYCCNEQYFQRSKALFFGDQEAAKKIMDENDPHKILAIGKKIKGYKKETWDNQAYRVLKNVNVMKYEQNPEAQMSLINTGNRFIGEASLDRQYGIGISITSPNVGDKSEWKNGKNWMGQILTEIRESYKKNTES